MKLAQVIAANLAEHGIALVGPAIHGTDDPGAIAAAVDALCRETLGSGVADGLFYAVSMGAVAGVTLADGRRVVVKGYQPSKSARAFLEEIVRIRRHLTQAGVPSPAVLAGPTPFGQGLAIIEAFEDAGRIEDTLEPPYRRAMAQGFHDLVQAGRPLATAETLFTFSELRKSGRLWRAPSSTLADFAATAGGAEYIEDVARAATDQVAQNLEAGDLVIGHADWRPEHVKFVTDGEAIRIAAIYDWDSLQKRREPALVGVAASCFCANFGANAVAQKTAAVAPTLDQSRAFVADYEAARGRPFAPDERRLLSGAYAYTAAWLARLGHARGRRPDAPGTFPHLVATQGLGLLEL